MPSKYVNENGKSGVVVESDLFYDVDNARFALGVFSPNRMLSYGDGSIEQAILKLRSNVYIDQEGYLEDSLRKPDGTEVDSDDERSQQVCIFENRGPNLVAAVACGRLVIKDNHEVLPVENFFSESFSPGLPDGSIEISRFIAQHHDRRVNIELQKSLMMAGVGHARKEGLGPMYAVVDPYFERGLKLMLRSAIRRVSELKYIPEYKTENYAIEIIGDGVRSRLGKAAVDRFTIPVDSVVYWNKLNEES